MSRSPASLLLAASLVAACATTPPGQPEPPESSATVVYLVSRISPEMVAVLEQFLADDATGLAGPPTAPGAADRDGVLRIEGRPEQDVAVPRPLDEPDAEGSR